MLSSRGLNLTLSNGAPYELDVFLLIDGKSTICIECKGDENAKAFSTMYDLTFVSERGLAAHLARLF